jgi:hypothetical protein
MWVIVKREGLKREGGCADLQSPSAKTLLNLHDCSVSLSTATKPCIPPPSPKASPSTSTQQTLSPHEKERERHVYMSLTQSLASGEVLRKSGLDIGGVTCSSEKDRHTSGPPLSGCRQREEGDRVHSVAAQPEGGGRQVHAPINII